MEKKLFMYKVSAGESYFTSCLIKEGGRHGGLVVSVCVVIHTTETRDKHRH